MKTKISFKVAVALKKINFRKREQEQKARKNQTWREVKGGGQLKN